MTITRENCWSVRQCFERADQLSDEAEGSDDALVRRQRELIAHLCVNLKAGFATPMTPEPGRPRVGMPPVMYSQPTPMPKPLAAPRPPKVPPPPKEPKPRKKRERKPESTDPNGRVAARQAAQDRGLLGLPQMLAALCMTKGGFYAARAAGRIADPVEYTHGMPFWSREQLETARVRRARA